MKFFLFLPFLSVFACTQPAPPPPPALTQTTITDPLAYLAQSPENGGRHDWPLPVGYVALDNAPESDTKARQSWDFAPFGSYEPERGDGFQMAEVGKDGWVRFTSTRDGGTPWIQHFVGQRCNGTGWIVFGTDAQAGQWRDVVATLNIARDPGSCPDSLNAAYTRYRLEPVTFPFAVKGAREVRTIPTIISEHYNGPTITSAVSLERSYLGQGYGLIRWEAWGPEPPTVDLSQRCSPVEWSVAPVAEWNLRDCRTYTVLP